MGRVPLELALCPDESRLTLAAFIRDATARHAPKVALRFEGKSITFAQLGREVVRAARGLVGAGVVKGARVGVWMANRPEWVIASFAAARVGAVLVPVNTFASAEERDYILRHGDVSLLLMQPGLLRHDYLGDLLRDHPELSRGTPGRLRIPALPALRRVLCLGLDAPRGAIEPWSELERLGADVSEELVDALSDEVTPSDEGVIIYTSGTTAHPKGVLHMTRAPVINSYRFAELMALTPADRSVTAQPFFWTAGMCHSLGSHLAAGATLIIEETFDPGRALQLAADEKATMVIAWPHQEKAMAEHPLARQLDLSSLKKLEFDMPLARVVGLEKNEWGIYGSFGMSETFTFASAYGAWESPERRKTNGPPLPGMSIKIVDPETGAELGPEQRGEVAVKGVTFMRGYYKVDPEEYLDADGYFHTRDGGSLTRAGELKWTGRLSNMIKTGGANVSPLEIETALAGCPGVSVGVAVGIPHPTLGEVVVLAAVPAPGERVDEETVRAHLRERLSAYKVPRRVFAFGRTDLDFTGTQKVQVEPLREKILARLREERAEISGHTYASR
jgi:acyl-CoA synthetase (AMP-forming)/AMP-acid ligase II